VRERGEGGRERERYGEIESTHASETKRVCAYVWMEEKREIKNK
jgi:hypothetical protein